MKATDKIYLQVCGDCEINDCNNCFFKDLEDNVTWSKDRISPRDIEYTRTDAFIEKACGWIREKWDDNYTMPIIIDSVIEDFKNYMKGK